MSGRIGTVASVAGAGVGGVTLLATVNPQIAKSNLSKWLDVFGIDVPALLASPDADWIIRIASTALIIVSIFYLNHKRKSSRLKTGESLANVDQTLVADMRALSNKLRRAVQKQPDWQSDSDVTDPFVARIDAIADRLKHLGIVVSTDAYKMTATQWADRLESIATPLERGGVKAARAAARKQIERQQKP